MPFNHKHGDLLEGVKQGIIVHQVNAQGVMGGGIAKQIRDKWPAVWEEYSRHILPNQPGHGIDYLGRVIYVEVEPGLWVANVVGQQFYGRNPKIVYTSYEALEMGLNSVRNFANNYGLDVHYPMIGCGLANGDWTRVSQLLNAQFDTINHTYWEYTPEA